ncbi:MAG: hypothetical protein H7329_15055, partial [Opitutaceae bacterium]|nr:hypothetical protein [Cytophagales bacterium]
KKFDIYIDDQKLTTLDNTSKWNQSRFIIEEYAIPEAMIKNKDKIKVKFQSTEGASTSPIYYVRLLKSASAN